MSRKQTTAEALSMTKNQAERLLEHFIQAITHLATSPGSLRERLPVAIQCIAVYRPEEIPEELKAMLNEMHEILEASPMPKFASELYDPRHRHAAYYLHHAKARRVAKLIAEMMGRIAWSLALNK